MLLPGVLLWTYTQTLRFRGGGGSDLGTVRLLEVVVERSCSAVRGGDIACVLIGLPVEKLRWVWNDPCSSSNRSEPMNSNLSQHCL